MLNLSASVISRAVIELMRDVGGPYVNGIFAWGIVKGFAFARLVSRVERV